MRHVVHVTHALAPGHVKEVATVIRLRLFGSVELKDSLGHDIGALLTRPKRLALLAYLAATGRAGYARRDELLACFWPDLDGPRARNALNQAVRTIRQALGAAALQSRGDEEIRVDPAFVWCDVAEFRAAIDSARYGEALVLYRGELLHGFFAPNAGGFEQWLEYERTVLRRAAADSARLLAEAHDARGDLTAAVAGARRAMELSDGDERTLRHLLDLLDRLGDRAAALGEYEAFARTLRDDLAAAPTAETIALADRIRRRNRAVAAETRAEPNATAATDGVMSSDALAPHVRIHPAVTGTPRRVLGIRVVAAAVALLLVVTGAVSFARSRARRTPAPSGDRVAVFPVQVHANADLHYLSQGTMVLLEQALDGVGDLRRVEPHVLASRLDFNTPVIGADRARAVAMSVGAGRWILGNIVEVGDSIRLSLSLYHARWIDSVAFADGQGSVARIDELVKTTLTRLLVAQQVGSGARLKLNPALTSNFEALKAYLQAEALLRRGEQDTAARLLERAVAVDSEFALAWYRLSFARNFIEGITGLPQGGMEAIRAAMRHQARLTERDRKLVAIYHALVHGHGQIAERRAMEFTWEYPEEAEGWTTLAITQIWHAWQQGRDPAIAQRAYERAVAVDAEHRDARHFLVRMAMARRDYAAIDSITRQGAAQGGIPIGGTAAALVSAFGQRDSARQRELIAKLGARPNQQLLTLAINVAKHTDDLEGAARIARLMTDSAALPAVRKQGHYLLALVAFARGRRTEAKNELRAITAVEGRSLEGYDILLRAWLASTPALAVPAADLRSIRHTLERWRPPTSAPQDSLPPWHQIQWSLGPAIRLYLLGLVSARLGDARSALSHASALERLTIVPNSANLITDLALEIRALVAAEAGHTADALSIIERQNLKVRWIYDIHNPLYFRSFGRLLRADLLRKTGRDDEALAWYAAFAWSASPEFVYLAPVNLGQARSLERLGRSAEAATYYRRFIVRWQDADSDLRHEVSRARANLSALERQNVARR